MKPEGKIVALVPLRGGSKSIPKKNIKMLAGKPLCAWTLEAAKNVGWIDEIYVSTDSAEIANVVSKLGLGIKIIERPAEYARDESSTESVMIHFSECVNFDWLITLQATSPLTKSEHIMEALLKVGKDGLDSLLTCVRVKRFFWTMDGIPINYDPNNRPRRQDFEGTFMENGAFYITKKETLDSTKCRLGGKIGIYEMPAETEVEIDEPEDWQKLEEMIRKQKQK